ncbi:hypothetical protein EVAR_12340_1 [Eumeta japonica]|uniref:Uncharacterized protein n=1 Tax=Eumeta variegata TaxID=151549 RepID=A0A4C1WZ69_EUMVA|nr:hypothetical protein EVAR_12340_1 [Eumeta japonica]
MEWKREIVLSALSLARSAQEERDNESYFFVRAAGVHRFLGRYHVKKKIVKNINHHLNRSGSDLKICPRSEAVPSRQLCYFLISISGHDNPSEGQSRDWRSEGLSCY